MANLTGSQKHQLAARFRDNIKLDLEEILHFSSFYPHLIWRERKGENYYINTSREEEEKTLVCRVVGFSFYKKLISPSIGRQDCIQIDVEIERIEERSLVFSDKTIDPFLDFTYKSSFPYRRMKQETHVSIPVAVNVLNPETYLSLTNQISMYQRVREERKEQAEREGQLTRERVATLPLIQEPVVREPDDTIRIDLSEKDIADAYKLGINLQELYTLIEDLIYELTEIGKKFDSSIEEDLREYYELQSNETKLFPVLQEIYGWMHEKTITKTFESHLYYVNDLLEKYFNAFLIYLGEIPLEQLSDLNNTCATYDGRAPLHDFLHDGLEFALALCEAIQSKIPKLPKHICRNFQRAARVMESFQDLFMINFCIQSEDYLYLSGDYARFKALREELKENLDIVGKVMRLEIELETQGAYSHNLGRHTQLRVLQHLVEMSYDYIILHDEGVTMYEIAQNQTPFSEENRGKVINSIHVNMKRSFNRLLTKLEASSNPAEDLRKIGIIEDPVLDYLAEKGYEAQVQRYKALI
ncbi:hypothetical protein JXB41_05620 [Candidatus Woesearchaeota archaeon]|nr:hypothetical protein [Candidatus Woesearchaeota archaeon]